MRRANPSLLQRISAAVRRPLRGLTLGVQGIVLDRQGRVLLIKHSYVRGWHFPGGGVEAGETVRAALARELREEANVEIAGEPELHGIFFNARISRRDHVAVYVVRDFRQDAPPRPGVEIIDHGFFPPDDLPEDAALAVRARLAELLSGAPLARDW